MVGRRGSGRARHHRRGSQGAVLVAAGRARLAGKVLHDFPHQRKNCWTSCVARAPDIQGPERAARQRYSSPLSSLWQSRPSGSLMLWRSCRTPREAEASGFGRTHLTGEPAAGFLVEEQAARTPVAPGLPERDQHRAGQLDILQTSRRTSQPPGTGKYCAAVSPGPARPDINCPSWSPSRVVQAVAALRPNRVAGHARTTGGPW